MSQTVRILVVAISLATFAVGCSYFEKSRWGTRYLKKTDRIILGRDHVRTGREPILEIARCITRFEDDLRRDGTISAKVPDVWTDSNLMHSIQEFDQEMEKTLGKFSETIQAYLSESDRQGMLSELAAIYESAGSSVSSVPKSGNDAKSSAAGLLNDEDLKINAADKIFSVLSAIPDIAKPTGNSNWSPRRENVNMQPMST